MATVSDQIKRVTDFLKRQPNLDGSMLLKKESDALAKAAGKYAEKAENIELSLKPEYAETLALIEGDGKNIATTRFIKEFSATCCSRTLEFEKADKKARKELVDLAARENKLSKLKKALDPERKYREQIKELMKLDETTIASRILAMTAQTFKGLVEAVGLEATRTSSGAISTSKANKNKVLKQILHMKRSDEYLAGLDDDA